MNRPRTAPPLVSEESVPFPNGLRADPPERALWIIGEDDLAGAVARAVEDGPFRPRRVRHLADALDATDRGRTVDCLVLVPPAGDGDLADAVRECRGSPAAATLPVVAVVRSGFPDEEAIGVLEAGANGIAAWPTDAAILGGWLRRLLGKDPKRAPDTDPDRCLARSVEAKLAVSPAFRRRVSAVALDGVVVVRGAGEQSRQAARLASSVPGVRRAMIYGPGGILGA